MPLVILQGEEELKLGIHYEYDSDLPPIGKGGMGTVYKGKMVYEANDLKVDVAIKHIHNTDPKLLARARREASIKVQNQNLVRMYGFVEGKVKNELGDAVTQYYVVSELLKGVMLDDLLLGNIAGPDGQPVAVAENLYQQYRDDPYHFALYVVKNILSGIMTLHDAGYIHRDIDPTNVMLTHDGQLKLIDFGIAKQLNTLTSQDRALTTAGQFMGKSQYAAPELVVGDIHNQNQTTDIYAVGILLYQLVVGHAPFEGTTYEVLEDQLHKKVPVEVIPQRSLRDVISKATAKMRDDRYQTAAEFRVAIEKLEKLPYPDKPTLTGMVKRHARLLAAALAAVAVVVAVAWFVAGGGPTGSDRASHDSTQMADDPTLVAYTRLQQEADLLLQDVKQGLESDGLKDLRGIDLKLNQVVAKYDEALATYSGKSHAEVELGILKRGRVREVVDSLGTLQHLNDTISQLTEEMRFGTADDFKQQREKLAEQIRQMINKL